MTKYQECVLYEYDNKVVFLVAIIGGKDKLLAEVYDGTRIYTVNPRELKSIDGSWAYKHYHRKKEIDKTILDKIKSGVGNEGTFDSFQWIEPDSNGGLNYKVQIEWWYGDYKPETCYCLVRDIGDIYGDELMVNIQELLVDIVKCEHRDIVTRDKLLGVF